MTEVSVHTVGVVPFPQRELANTGITINPNTMVVLPPKGHVPTLDEIALLKGIDVRIAERGGVKVVGVPIGTDAYAREIAMEIVEKGGAEQLARMLLRMPDKRQPTRLPPAPWCSEQPTLSE